MEISSLKGNLEYGDPVTGVFDSMPALAAIMEEFARSKPLLDRSVPVAPSSDERDGGIRRNAHGGGRNRMLSSIE